MGGMAAKRHLGDGGEVPHAVSAGVPANGRLSDKDRFCVSDRSRDALHPAVVKAASVQDHSRRITSVRRGGKGGITHHIRSQFHPDIVARKA